MAFEIRFEKIQNHIIADIEGAYALIDTGSPYSIGSRPLPFAGHEYPVRPSASGADLKEISEQLVVNLEWLIGADVLGHHRIDIDWSTGTLGRADTPQEADAVEPMMVFKGIPVITVILNDARTSMFFDTGAKISYARKELVEHLDVTGHAEDFYPGFGRFKTPLRDVHAKISGQELTLKVGQLPQLLEANLLSYGVHGIVGNDIFETFSKVSIDYPARRFAITR